MANVKNKDPRFRIEVSRDHFTAYLHVRGSVKEGELTINDILKELADDKIVYGVKERDKIRIFLENLELYNYTFVIAAGKPFTHGQDAEIKFYFDTDAKYKPEEDWKSTHSVDFRHVGRITSVKKGEVVATKSPATQGEGGITVYGQKLPGEWGMDVTLIAGENVSVSPNGLEYIAEVGGAPFFAKNTIRVDEVLVIEGDVNYEVGSIQFDGSVAIKGSVLDGFSVNARGDVIVDNTVQAGEVTAGGDVIVRRGILNRQKTKVSAEGNVYAKFIENSIVEADGDIIVQNAILNSKTNANRNVVALTGEGSIIGGETLAFDHVLARNVGSLAHVKTYVQAGYRFDVQRQYLDTQAKLRSIQKKLDEVRKSYDYISASSGDLDKLGDLRGKAMKLMKLQEQMQDDLTEIGNGRVFNQFASIEGQATIYPGSVVFLGDSPFPVSKEMAFTAIKWDSDNKNVYFTSFDETGKAGATKPTQKAKTVLVVDDSKAVRQTLKLILEKMGLRVSGEAEDGVVGVQRYKELKPTLVTLDISMVNMNGIETLREIRQVNPKAKVIMISSNNDRKKILDCVIAGAADYILKPFVPKRVMVVVRSVLDN